MKKIIILVILLLSFFTFWYYSKNPLGAKLIINGHVIPIEVAITPEEKRLGLGGRDTLKEGTGMLFVYDHKDRYQFWMKWMRFPLDFVWIDGTTIVDLTENVPSPNGDSHLPIYQPNAPVDKILELNAGEVKKFGIAIGQTVKITD